MQQLTEMLVASLAGQEKHVRAQIPFALKVLEAYHLFRTGNVPQRLLAGSALSIYMEATTLHELEALQKALWALYEYYAQNQPALLPPAQNLPVKPPPPFWTSKKIPLSVCEQIVAAAEKGTAHSEQSIRLISMLLLLARHTGASSSTRLKALLLSETLIVLQDANRALYHDDKGWIFLDAVAMLLLRRLQDFPGLPRILTEIGQHFNEWINHFICHSSLSGASGWQSALNAVVFLDSPICMYSLAPNAKPLPQTAMVSALTGVVQSTSEPAANRNCPARISPVTFIIADANGVAPQQQLAYGSSEYDIGALRQLNFLLTKFQAEEPKGHRNSATFKAAKYALQSLEQHCQNRCSAVVNIIVRYCVNLFLTGSAWKLELAASTVKQYASTLKVFAEECWSDNTLLQEAQASADALYALTEHVVEAFDNILAADRQNTVSNFCQFIQQRIPLKLFDETGLEYIGAGSANTRAHYIAPQLFESALQDYLTASSSPLNQQTFWFLRLCYYLGLRHTEAAHLNVDDVKNEWLYVTRREHRKSRAAIRRVSLCFMPPQVCEAFLQWVSTRKRVSDHLFDEPVIDYSLKHALQILRELSDIADLVVHSLRHCAANNQAWLTSMAAFGHTKWRDRYFFCRAPLFNDENIMRVSTMFSSMGRRLAPHTSLLEFVASQLGHCAPSVTAASYLHLLDLLCWELNFVRTQIPLRDNVLPLLGGNNHRFAVWPKFEPYNESGLFRHAIQGLQSTRRIKIEQTNHQVLAAENFSDELSFSEYVSYLVEYQTLRGTEIDERLKQHLFQTHSEVDLSYLQSTRKTPAWMQLLDKINSIKWTRPNVNGVVTTHRVLGQESIRDIRTVRHVLQTCRLLGFQQTSFVFKCSSGRGLPSAWGALAGRYQLPIKEVKHQENFTALDLVFLKKPTAKALRFRLALMLTNMYLKYLKG